MKLFLLNALASLTKEVRQIIFKKEKHLQSLIENHLYELLGVRLVASQLSLPGASLDTVGLMDDKRPVIIEYKKVRNSSAVMQILSYRNRLKSNKHSFHEKLEDAELGRIRLSQIKWDKLRLICIAPDFDSHTLEGVQGEDFDGKIELVTYRYFDNGCLALEWKKGKQPKSPTIVYSGPGKEKKQAKSSAEKRLTKKERRLGKKGSADSSDVEQRKKFDKMSKRLEKSDAERRRIFAILCSLARALGSTGISFEEKKEYFVFKKGKKPFVFIRAYPDLKLIRFSVNLNPSEEELDGTLVEEGGIGNNGKVLAHLATEDDLEQTFHLVKKSYSKIR